MGFFTNPFAKKEKITAIEATSIDPKSTSIKRIGLAYSSNSTTSRPTWESPVGIDFPLIQSAYLTDGYIRQAIDKYSDFIFKAGWEVVGKNQAATDYIKARFNAISLATGNPFKEFALAIAQDLVKYHNVIILKAWAPGTYKYPGKLTVKPGLYTKTIAGYYILPIETILVARDTNGKILKYQQKVGGTTLEFKTDDVIHMAINVQAGRGFGYPFLSQAIDDVKMLRQLEELVYKMIFKHINPLIIYTVGLPQAGFQATDADIDKVTENMANLTMDGGIVVPERHKIESLGIDPIETSEYLKYYTERCFADLGVSSTVMGKADTSNRSTSDNLDQMFKDKVKAYQRSYAAFMDQFIIMELLFEGGFDPILKPDDIVTWKFKEIDTNAKIAEENHTAQMFMQNCITFEEMRFRIGEDPITDEARLYYNMFGANNAGNTGANNNNPTNQSGTTSKKATKASIEESFVKDLNSTYDILRLDILQLMKSTVIQKERVAILFAAAAKGLENNLLDIYKVKMAEGWIDCYKHSESTVQLKVFQSSNIEQLINSSTKNYILKELLEASMDSILNKDTSAINSIFQARAYKLKLINKSIDTISYNEGYLLAAKQLGIKKLTISHESNSCDTCKKITTINIENDGIPPFHVNCSCKLIYTKEE